MSISVFFIRQQIKTLFGGKTDDVMSWAFPHVTCGLSVPPTGHYVSLHLKYSTVLRCSHKNKFISKAGEVMNTIKQPLCLNTSRNLQLKLICFNSIAFFFYRSAGTISDVCFSSSRLSERSDGADGHHICEERERKRPGSPGGLVHR